MNLKPTSAEQYIVDAVHALVATHWRADPRQPGGLLSELKAEGMAANERSWFDALVRAGWAVPSWPREEGGPGWSRSCQFLFARALVEAGAPVPWSLATEVVAPLLFAAARSDAVTRWIEGIRTWQDRWCLGVAEPGKSQDLQTVARRNGVNFELNGEKTWVAGGQFAEWMLCLATLDDQRVWFVVPVRSTGVKTEALPVLGSMLAMARVSLQGLVVSADHCLGPALQQAGRPASRLASRLASRPLSAVSLVRSGALRRSLRLLRAEPAVLEDAALEHECVQLDVSLDGLEAIEIRGLLEPDFLPPSVLRNILAIRGAEAGQKLSELRARGMGYHALPFPVAERFSNEGLIGDELALPAVRQALFDRAWTLYAAHQAESAGLGSSSVEAMRDELARAILGVDPEEQTDTD